MCTYLIKQHISDQAPYSDRFIFLLIEKLITGLWRETDTGLSRACRPTEEAAHAFQRILLENGSYCRLRIERGGDIGAACGQLAPTSTTAAQKIYAEAAEKSGQELPDYTVVVDIEDLGQKGGTSNRQKKKDRAVKQPGGDAAVDSWRKRAVTADAPPGVAPAAPARVPVAKWSGLENGGGSGGDTAATAVGGADEKEDSHNAPGWTPPDGFLNKAEVRQLIGQLSKNNGLTQPEMTEAELSATMLEMEPDGGGYKVGVSAFAGWWERQHTEAESVGCFGSGGGENAVVVMVVAAGAAAAVALLALRAT